MTDHTHNDRHMVDRTTFGVSTMFLKMIEDGATLEQVKTVASVFQSLSRAGGTHGPEDEKRLIDSLPGRAVWEATAKADAAAAERKQKQGDDWGLGL